jgi:hypothetical protein
MLNNTTYRCHKYTYAIINLINFFVFIIGIFTIINLENVKFREICYEGIHLTYVLIVSNLIIPICIVYCIIYIDYFTNNDYYINFLNILIQFLEIFLGIIQLLVYILNQDCINMNNNKYLTDTERWWFELYNNTFIFTIGLLYIYILLFYCCYCLV